MTRVMAMALALLLTAAAVASAHEVRPGFLELRETDPGSYGFLWKKPSGGEIEIFIAPIVPAGCRFHTRCPYVKDRCRTETPLLREIAPGQHAACHFSETVMAGFARPTGAVTSPSLPSSTGA